MNLQGRDLSQGMTGADVRLLHQELQVLGFTFAQEELNLGLRDGDTVNAVMDFWRGHLLAPTWSVDGEPNPARLSR